MPTAAPPRRASQVRLEFGLSHGRTAALSASAQSPATLLFPRHAGEAAWACLGNLGGGLVDGDALELRVSAGIGARAVLTTQASTKVYPGSACQSVEARVADGGLLVQAFDPVVCYAGARYRQSMTYALEPEANAVVVDCLTSGRAARGERWRFERYESRLRLERGGEIELAEALRLAPPSGLGRFEALGFAAVTGPMLAAGARRERFALEAAAVDRRPCRLLSAAPFGRDGMLLRFAAESVEDAARELRSRLAFVWDALGDDPWSRRP